MIQQPSSNPYSVQGRYGFAEVREDRASLSRSLHSIIHFNANEVICEFSAAAILKTPTYLTIQTALEEHIHLKPEFLKFTNHSCDPNVFFDTDGMVLIALKDIQPGDEFGFFYPSTEWQMARPFECSCGSPACLKRISGAAQMPPDLLRQYRLTRFILTQLAI